MPKKPFSLAVAAVLAVALAGVAWGYETGVTNKIPGRYALAMVMGTVAGQPLDKEALAKEMKALREKEGVPYLQYAVYNEGDKWGRGRVRAFGEVYDDPSEDVEPQEFPPQDQRTDDDWDRALYIENVLAYTTTPAELYGAYTDNEVVADDDFKGKFVVMDLVADKIAKDALGNPYITAPAGKNAFNGLHVFIDKDDPFLRQAKKGDRVLVRGTVEGMVMMDVMVKGYIVKILDSQAKKGK